MSSIMKFTLPYYHYPGVAPSELHKSIPCRGLQGASASRRMSVRSLVVFLKRILALALEDTRLALHCERVGFVVILK